MAIPFVDLRPLHERLSQEIEAAMQEVVRSGWYLLGQQLEAFEAEYGAYHDGRYAVGVANGTDAIELALRAYDIQGEDEVITVAHTAVATVLAIIRAGATPVLVDIDPRTMTIDPAAVEAAITPRTRAIIPVHLYGQPANLNALVAIAEKHHLLLMEDCAQAHGAKYNGQLVGTFGQIASFSFYPTKNLGAMGDGGAVVTSDPAIAERLRRLRFYGQVSRYDSLEMGMNSRLDEIHAATLRIKLRHLDQCNQERRAIAQQYTQTLQNLVLPYEQPEAYHVYHLYVVRHSQRDHLMAALKEQQIGTLVHYPIPVHLQSAYHHLSYPEGSLPETERAAKEVLSLPLSVGMNHADVQTVAAALNAITQKEPLTHD